MLDFQMASYVTNRKGGTQRNRIRKRQVSYEFRPVYFSKNPHLQSDKPFCDILGRSYCTSCSEETMREASFVRSLTAAENFIASSATQSRASFVNYSRIQSADTMKESYFNEESKVNHLVTSIFPLMYKAYSSRPATTKSGDTYREVDRNPGNRKLNGSRSSTSSRISSTSSSHYNLVENIDEKEESADKSRSFQDDGSVCNSYSHDGTLQHDHNMEDSQTEIAEDDDFNGNLDKMSLSSENCYGKRGETPERSMKNLVRRSSVAGKHIQTDDNVRLGIEKWKPFIEKYPRRSKQAYQNKTPIALEKLVEMKDETQTLTLEKVTQPKLTKSILPMEPVVCGIKYIKNRWRDEAILKNNDFAIRLNLSRFSR